MNARGKWQAEVLREMAEMDMEPTAENLMDMANSYDDQKCDRVGEGTTAEGRAFLVNLQRAAYTLWLRVA